MIDWKMITEGYNLTHGRKFSTEELLEFLHNHMGSMRKMSNYLGVSPTALCRKMDLLNVFRVRKHPWYNK